MGPQITALFQKFMTSPGVKAHIAKWLNEVGQKLGL